MCEDRIRQESLEIVSQPMEKKRSPTLAFIPQHEANVDSVGVKLVVLGCFRTFAACISTQLVAFDNLIVNIHRLPWSAVLTMLHILHVPYCMAAFYNELCTLDTLGHKALQFDVAGCRVEHAIFLFLRPGGACALSGWPAFEGMMKDDEIMIRYDEGFVQQAEGFQGMPHFPLRVQRLRNKI